MKKLLIDEQKKIMVEILRYFDEKCRENNINYSLIGGSLIGAIRHKGIIPWDDDIDVILTKDNYEKIIKVLLNENNSRYKLLTTDNCPDYFFPFPKLVDTKTFVIEPMSLKQIDEYGIYIDIFSYFNISDDKNKAIKTVKKIKLYNRLISRRKTPIKKLPFSKVCIGIIRNLISFLIGKKKLLKMIYKISNNVDNINSSYVVSNWPIYPIEKEIQLSKNIEEYIDVPFENMTVMIFKNYDEILKTTFGDYMKLPPEDKRVCHGLIAYWRDDEDEKSKK